MGISMLVEKCDNQESLVITGYKGSKSSDILDGNENFMFRHPLRVLEQKFSRPHS